MIVSFRDYELVPRYDGKAWFKVRINESSSQDGPWTQIDELALDPIAADPSDPEPVWFTTEKATLEVGVGWYRVDLVDTDDNIVQTDPVFNAPPIEIMASLDDINAHLDGEVIEATSNNTDLVQVSVARIIRGYLAGVVDQTQLMTWQTPATTPEIIREIAAMLIAAQVYFNESSRTSLLIPPDSFAQRMYDEAMALLMRIVNGDMTIIPPDTNGDGVTPPSVDTLTVTDFFPVDSTDRAFTLGMQL